MNVGEKERERTEMVFVEEGFTQKRKDALFFIFFSKAWVVFFVGAEGEAEAGMQIKSVCACLAVFVSLSVCVHLSVYVR